MFTGEGKSLVEIFNEEVASFWLRRLYGARECVAGNPLTAQVHTGMVEVVIPNVLLDVPGRIGVGFKRCCVSD